MTRRQMHRRLRARLRDDERGFTLLETIIAVTVIFGSILTLAYASLASFRYQGIARQRQTANGVAAQVMEQVRGLAYDTVTAGLLETDLTGDPNIVSCSGVYRFLSCSAGSDTGSGEAIVSSPGLTTTTPLVPHRSTSSTWIEANGVTYDWATYVTRDDAATEAPYRVTVVITWTSGVTAGVSSSVRVQSLFWSPEGCLSTTTHPFAAPCQPFFLANATVPNGSLDVEGTLGGTTFSKLKIALMGTSTTVQQEQISSAEGSVHTVEATVTDATTRSAGGITATTDADGDPNTLAAAYSRKRCGTELTCSGGTLTSPTSPPDNYIQITVPTTTTGESDSAVTANAASPCPPAAISATAQTDSQPCSGAVVQQASMMSGVAHLHDLVVDVGDAEIVRAAAQVTNSAKAFVERVNNPAPAGSGCTPAASTDGCVSASASRTYGNIRLGGLPEEIEWRAGDPFDSGSCLGFFVSLVSYADSATAAAGDGAPASVANLPSGNLHYYDQATGSCTSVALSSAAITGLNTSYTTTQNVDGVNVTVTIGTVVDGMVAASSTVSATGSPQTDASAQVISPRVTITYTITTPGQTILDVTESITLGTLTADATYAPAPSAA
jgi:type II secretory pathway pseudopilin PulG